MATSIMKLVRNLGRQVVGSYVVNTGLFLCDYCKKEVDRDTSNGHRAKSCGCHTKQLQSKAKIRHGDCKPGAIAPLYSRWASIRQWCNNEKSQNYRAYGAVGIRVCDQWNNSYQEFKKWAVNHGYQSNLELCRRDKKKNYEPKNCYFGPRSCAMRGSSNSKLTMGKTRQIRDLHGTGDSSYSQLGCKFGVTPKTIKAVVLHRSWKEAHPIETTQKTRC
jgi:hypothetical protein